MSQNTSSAVMQQRSEPHDSLDDFPTQPWATRALCAYIAQYSSRRLSEMSCREPCANRGHMVRPLLEHFRSVEASDVHDYGAGFPVADYLFPAPLSLVDWTFFNPPFRLAADFIRRGIQTSDEGVAAIVRNAFLEGDERYRDLYSRPETRPDHVLQFVSRVVMLKGRLVRSGSPDPSNENPNKKASTATAYSALVWLKRRRGPTLFDWIGARLALVRAAGRLPRRAARFRYAP
jgi:hypothetical protein